MEGRGECCIARYVGARAYNMPKVDRIMLRFRPIAPKPATGGSVSGGSSPESGDACVKTGRGKRKYVKDNNNNNSKRCNTKKRKVSSEEAGSGGDPVVTLSLLPETPDRKESPATDKKQGKNVPIWLSFNRGKQKKDNREICGMGDVAVSPDPTVVKPVRSYLTVECVSETWVDGDGLGYTNEERMMNLEEDTCPALISDGQNRVLWANKAYREVVGQGQGQGEMVVWLLMKEWVSLPVTCPAFTCRVSWVTCGKEKKTLTCPCDVWKMNGGGFAWRLDVKAALCLGR